MAIKTFTRKNYGTLYTWSVNIGTQGTGLPRRGKKVGCTATAGGQGEDWSTGYSYYKVVVNGVLQRLAYVQCGYVA
tara:strand:+ start:1053 stop:1280 length:228 start_codon:yes stop_codon:yes gene_type:complete